MILILPRRYFAEVRRWPYCRFANLIPRSGTGSSGSGTGPGSLVPDLEEICEIEEIPAGAGLPAVRARRPDVVIARVEEGGLDLLRELRRDPGTRDVPILLLGGPGAEGRCLDGLDAGASDYLVEPFSPRALAARVAAALRAAHGRRESLLRERDLLAETQMAAEALDRSEERFHSFLRYSPVASWITDEEGRIVFLSEPYTRIFGIRQEDALGRSPFELYPAAFAQNFYDNIRAVAETGGTMETIEDAPRPDGSVGHFLVYKFPVRDERGRLLVGGVAADITAMKQAEEALRLSEERFRLATEAVNGMIYDWSVDDRRRRPFPRPARPARLLAGGDRRRARLVEGAHPSGGRAARAWRDLPRRRRRQRLVQRRVPDPAPGRPLSPCLGQGARGARRPRAGRCGWSAA